MYSLSEKSKCQHTARDCAQIAVAARNPSLHLSLWTREVLRFSTSLVIVGQLYRIAIEGTARILAFKPCSF